MRNAMKAFRYIVSKAKNGVGVFNAKKNEE